MQQGKLVYVMVFNDGDSYKSWCFNILEMGIVMEVFSGCIIIEGLVMLYFSWFYYDGLYVLQFGKGELICIDFVIGVSIIVFIFLGFLWGMD